MQPEKKGSLLMSNFGKPETVGLDEVKERILSSDLVPSRASLADDTDQLFDMIAKTGIHTLADLQKMIRNQSKIELFCSQGSISLEKMILLRREVESYRPKSFKLAEVEWLPRDEIGRLINLGISTSEDVLKELEAVEDVEHLAYKTRVKLDVLNHLVNLCNLAKVQWVSLNFARMLIEAGYAYPQVIAAADAEKLCNDLERINPDGKFFNGKIGKRDIKRLIHATQYAT